jgi:hypothetical protein
VSPRNILALSVHPNPFSAQSTITYNLASPVRVRLAVFDVTGRRVASLADAVQSDGAHTAVWSGIRDDGRPAGPGIYLLRLAAGSQSSIRKIVFRP